MLKPVRRAELVPGEFDPRDIFRRRPDFSRLYQKLSRPDSWRVTDSICCWTDLLGFGRPLAETGWSPSEELWGRLFDRVAEAHACCYQHLEGMTEFVLTLNDGIIRTCDVEQISHLDELSMWLRACIWTHNLINERERHEQLPGARTVLAQGQKLEHGVSEITVDDLVANYTKRSPDGPSRLPRHIATRSVALNPLPLQFNLAFSKAYILDDLGSKKGIAGPHFYVDQSVLDFASTLAEAHNLLPLIDARSQTGRTFAVPKSDRDYYHFGFLLEGRGIPIDVPQKIKTTVWRVLEFHPWDEPQPFTLEVL